MNIDYDNILGGSDYDSGSENVDNDDELPELIDESEKYNSVEQNTIEYEYLQAIQNKIQLGQIDDYTFMLEKLMIEYKQALKYRRFNVDNEEDKNKISRIGELKLELQTELVNGVIEEIDFTRKYYNLLRLEYTLLLTYEDYTLKSRKMVPEMPELIDTNIEELIKKEHIYLKTIAKQRNIPWPDKPKINKKDTKLVRLQKYIIYHLELNKASQNATQYIPGYKIRTFEERKIGEETKWVIMDSDKFVYENLKQEYKESKSDSPLFVDTNLELKNIAIKNVLKTKTREELLNCIISENIINKLSYIETLKNNTVAVMKFREYPETYEKLKEIIGKEAKYYKITENDLMKDFNKKFFDVSPNINLSEIPKTYNPTFYVKIKDQIYNTDIPKSFDLEKKENKELYKINPSVKGYSFLLKIDKIPNKRNKRISEYTEKGSVVSLSLKPAYFKTDKVPSGVIDEKFYNIIKPLPDDLYNELKEKNLPELNTELSRVYELHIPVKELSKTDNVTQLVRRYENFEDYLKDLLSILESNFLILERTGSLKSADILYIRIQKIKKYLETGVDPEFDFFNRYSLNDLINQDKKIKGHRENGINKLREYIFAFYPQNEPIIEVLENNIFEFNNKEYLLNIDKIIFIFREFDDSLDNYINNRLSFIELISMELPLIKPNDDLQDIYTNTEKTFRYLYSWLPNSDNYLKYKEKLDLAKNDIIQFKKMNTDLTDLELNEIYDEMLEYKQWENSKKKLSTLQIPTKKNPVRIFVDFLKKERNRLMSRRIYRVAKIRERLLYRQDLVRIFSNCNLSNFEKSDIITLSESVENIAYSLSNKPDAYYFYIDLVKNTYKTLCNLITEKKVIIPIVTEFIIKEGDLNYINIERLNKILTVLDEDNKTDNNLIIKLLETLRHKELLAYRTSLIEEQNKEPTNYKLKLIQAINKVIDSNKTERKKEMYSIANNTYISPVVTNIIPKIQHGPDSFYIPEYYIIGENEYIYGGNFPDFINNETNEINYTNDEIYSLAILLKLDYKENIDIKELYYECMEKLKKYSSSYKQVYSKQVLLDYNPTLITKKLYTSYINYIYRPRIGVKPPGDVYIVYTDTHKVSYCVPFEYNEYGVPVYSSKFLDENIKPYYYIEGPSEFKEDLSGNNFSHSTMYILVEYKDTYGNTKLFREGVDIKKIKKSPKENFDACNRFTNEIDCNDLKSYGMEKMKCKFIKGKCISIKEQLKEEKLLIDIPSVTFKRALKKIDKSGITKYVTDYYKTKLWNEAVKTATNFVVQLIAIKNLTAEQIKQETVIQREGLTKYYDVLQKLDTPQKLKTIIETPNYSNLIQSLLPETKTEIKPEIKQEIKQEIKKEINTETKLEEIVKYKYIRLPKLVTKNIPLSSKQLSVGVKYIIEDNTLATLISKTNTDLEFSNVSNNNIIKFKIGTKIVKNITPEKITEYKYFKITSENLELIYNPPQSFTYRLIEKLYDFKINEIIVNEKIVETKEFPLNILYLIYTELFGKNEETLEKDVIDRNMVYNAMATVNNGVYEKDANGFLEPLDIFPATIEAKIQALKYGVNLLQLARVIKGEIKLDDVINYYNKTLPAIKTVSQEIISQLQYGMLHGDIKLLKRYVNIAQKQLNNENNETINQLIFDSNIIIEKDTSINEKDKTTNEKDQTTNENDMEEKPKIEQKSKYVVSKRRKKPDD